MLLWTSCKTLFKLYYYHYFTVSTCEDPGVPVNGSRVGDSFTVGSSVSFECSEGFNLEGLSSITCGANGKWNAEAPTCSGRVFILN